MAEKRDEKLKEISEKLEQGVKELFTSERYAQYLATMSKFHNYSFNNTLLIAMQKPDATLVAGYQAWQKKFGRQVKKGEKGIQIIAPVPVRHKEEVEKLDPETHEPVLKDDGQPETEEIVTVIPRFRVTTVFDVGQTYGKPLPELGNGDLTAGVEDYEIFMEALRRVSPVPMRFTQMEGTSHGYYHNVDKEIVIKDGMSESQTMKTAVHEISHAKLHDREIMEEQGIEKDKETKEVEAESIAFMVCQSFGLDTSDYSFPYIAGWSGSREMKELRTSMDTIRKTAGELIDSIGDELKELQKERAQEIRRDDIIFRITFDENDKTYHLVRNMGKAELLEQLATYHGFNPETRIGVGDFLIDLGAELTPLPSPGEENENFPVTFYDVEYDYRSGVHDVAELPAMAFAEMHIARAEYGKTLFTDEERNLIVNYAFKLDDKESVQRLVRDLTDAVEAPEQKDRARIAEAAQAEIDALPDSMVGLSEMHEFGYTEDSMLPLTAARAEELYIIGNLKIFCLYPDGTEAAVEDAEMFRHFEGMYGVEKQAWENHLAGQKERQLEADAEIQPESRLEQQTGAENSLQSEMPEGRRPEMPEEQQSEIQGRQSPEIQTGQISETQPERYQEVEVFGVPMLYHDGRMLDGDVPEGLIKYDLRGMDLDPGLPATIEEVVVVNHAASVLSAFEIDLKKDGALMLGEGLSFTGNFMTAKEYREMMAAKDKEMLAGTMENEIGLANENLLWNGGEDRYAIYQINEQSLSRENLFMNLDYLQTHGKEVHAQDYDLIYSGKLAEGVTLDAIYAWFNYDHPADYTGHSLSVGDVVVLQRNGKVTAHFVDSSGFPELPDFVRQRQTVYQANRMVGNTHSIHENSIGIEVEQHDGTWHVVDNRAINGQEFFLVEHEEFGNSVAGVIVDANGELVAQELENGFDTGAYQAIREYFTERGIPVYDRRLIAETENLNQEEKAAVAEEISAGVEQAIGQEAKETENQIAGEEAATPVTTKGAAEKTYPPVYPHLLSYAKDHGEVDLYLDSRKLNIDCKNAIEMAIRENFDGWHLNHDAAAPVLEEYGAERVSFILTNTMNHQDYDGRYSRANREWAKGVPVFDIQANGRDLNLDYLLTTHPAVLDGFIDLVRQEIKKREQVKEQAAEKPFIERYYVAEKAGNGKPLESKHFDSLEDALSYYFAVPNQKRAALGAESTVQTTWRVDFLRCQKGMDEIVRDYEDSEEWNRPEITELVKGLERGMESHDVAIAYEIPDGYFSIQTTDEGYDYSFYDKEGREIDGGIYDDTNIPVKEVIEDLLDEQGLTLENCTVTDYDAVKEEAERKEREHLLRVGLDLFFDKGDTVEESADGPDAGKRIPIVSEHNEPEKALNGLSRAEIEETVVCLAQAEIDDMGLSEDVKLIGARVYGSRTRDGLYKKDSDVDVVLSYSGGIKEDYFFNVLHETGMNMAGMKLDINPISTEETGTLEDYLAKAEAYLDEKEAVLEAEGRTAEPETSMEERLTFYAAECDEFHVLGEFDEGLTLKEAVERFNQMPPERINGIPCIGFRYEDGGSIYDGTECDIYRGGEVLWDEVNETEYYRNSPLVQETLKEVQEMAERGEIRGYMDREPEAEIAQDAADKVEIQQMPETEQEIPQGIPTPKTGQEIAAESPDQKRGQGKAQEPQVHETMRQSTEEKGGQEPPRVQSAASKTEERKSSGKKESVLQALRQRQAKLREQEKTKGKEQSKNHKKGDVAL